MTTSSPSAEPSEKEKELEDFLRQLEGQLPIRVLSWKVKIGLDNSFGTAGEPRFKTEIGEEKLNDVADRAFLGSKDLISLLNSLHGA